MSINNSVIKGYHVHKIQPPIPTTTPLIVDREYTNISDQHACLVWMPPRTAFTAETLAMVTDEKRCLTVADIADLPVGHVPRGLAGAFRTLLDVDAAIRAVPTGMAVQSFAPWPSPGDIGGGAVVPCYYTIKHIDREFVLHTVKTALDAMPEKDVMDVV